MSKDSTVKLFTLFLIFFLLMNFPILSVSDKEAMSGGWPLLFLYLFAAWFLLIGFTVWLVGGKPKS